MEDRPATEVPTSLKIWFVVHFAVDVIFGLPLLIVPEWLMPALGWQYVDPLTSRLVGAALIGIGVASWAERQASAEVFRAMLNLKIIWATSALIGIGLAAFRGAPPVSWLIFLIFAGFLALWVIYRMRLYGH